MAEKKFLDVGTHRICYIDEGSGPPLVLIHGFLVSHKDWLPSLPRLKERFRVIALDLPGHGDSARPSPSDVRYDATWFASTVARMMEGLGIAKASVVGHSTGGKIAAYLAVNHPEKVERLVLSDAQGLPQPLPLLGKLVLLPVIGKHLFKNLYTRATVGMYFKGDVFKDPRHVTDELVDEIWRCFNLPGSKDALYATLQNTVTPGTDFHTVLGGIRVPVKLIWGEFDKIYPPKLADEFRRHLPGAPLTVIKGVGHAPPVEAPDEMAREILEFCTEPLKAAAG